MNLVNSSSKTLNLLVLLSLERHSLFLRRFHSIVSTPCHVIDLNLAYTAFESTVQIKIIVNRTVWNTNDEKILESLYIHAVRGSCALKDKFGFSKESQMVWSSNL